ncbi:MAG: hypothetical protein ACOZQL_15145 [Myxococcota bacterium]
MSPLLAWLAVAASAPLQQAADAGSSSSRTPGRGDVVFISERASLDMEAEGAARAPVPPTPSEGYVAVRVLDIDGVMALVETENVESPWPSYQRRFGIPLTVRGFIRTEALLVTPPPAQEKPAAAVAGLGGMGPRHGITVSGVAVWSNGRRAGRVAGWYAFDEVSLNEGSACASRVPMLAHEICFADWKESPAARVPTFGQLGSVASSAETLPEPLRVLVVRSELDAAATLPWTAGVLGKLRFCAESARLTTVDVTFTLSVEADGRVRAASMKDGASLPGEVKACFSKVLESRRLSPQSAPRSLDVRLTNAK